MTDATELAQLREITRFIFDWFNEIYPLEMERCLRAYEDARHQHQKGT